ncbi:MAG: MG2 domain-containing protein [Treponema sp.]|nr:MG2 domain-containing protein [Treponema sp.]
MKKPHILLLLICVVFASLLLASCGRVRGRQATTVFSASHVSPGRPAAGLEDFRISYFQALDPAALAAGGFDTANFAGAENIEESAEPFTIVDYGPRGELPSEIQRPSIYVVFSQPAVPLSRLGEVIRQDAGLFSIEPPIRGVYRWYGTRLLSFEPDGDTLPQQEYSITVSDRIRSLGGKSLEGERSFSFETERLSVLSWELGTGESWVNSWNADPNDARNISLIFSYPVELQEIAKWMEVSVLWQRFPFTLSRLPEIDDPYRMHLRSRYSAEQGVLLTLDDTLPLDSEVRLQIFAGARSQEGWLGSRHDVVFSFHTLRPFAFEHVSVRAEARPRTEEGDSIPISLQFSQNVDPDIEPSLFSVQGMPPLTSDNVRVFGNTVVINNLPLEYERSYQVRISSGVRDLWGRTLGQEQFVQANVGEANSYIYFLNTGPGMLEAGFPPLVVWETQNPLSIRSRIAAASGPYERLPLASLSAQNLSAFPRNTKRYVVEDLSPFLGPGGKGSATMAWDHETLSQWQRGRTIRGNAWLSVQVTDIGITLRYSYNRVLVWATKLSTGEAAANARVELLEGTSVIRSGLTDSRGLAVFEFPDGEFAASFTHLYPHQGVTDWSRGFRVRVIEGGGAMAGGDQAEFIPNESHNIWRFRVEASAAPFNVEEERPLIYLFTDRGIYRPGETVTFRGLDRSLRRGSFLSYEGDYNIQVSGAAFGAPAIASLSGRSTESGGSHGSFSLPENLEPGTYVIRYRRGAAGGAASGAASGANSNIEQSIAFTVANFERLRFQADVEFPELLFYQGENISARLSASYLAGGAMAGAPYSYYWSRELAGFQPASNAGAGSGAWRNWRFGPEIWDGRSYLGEGEGVLGPDGSTAITHNAREEGVEGAAYRYLLEASVQDPARQEISARSSVLVHPASFYLASRLDAGNLRSVDSGNPNPSAYFLPAGSPATISWALLDPEGNPFSGTETPVISLQLIRHEWRQARQAGVGGRIILNWERVEVNVMERSFSPGRNEYSGVIPFNPSASGQWEIRLSSRDSRGRSVHTRYGFFVSGAGWVHWGGFDLDVISLSPDRPSYAPGETARLLVRSPLPSGQYLLTLEREGIIEERIIELDGSARSIDIPIRESYLPIVYVALSSFSVRSGPPEHTYYEPDLDKPRGIFGLASLLVDTESRNYRIEIETSKSVYSPGEEAEVTLKVSLGGRPAPNVELSFLTVDRGVLDLIDYRVPDPLAFFYNPENFPLAVRGADSRSLLIDPVTYNIRELQGGDGKDAMGRAPDQVVLDERQDFRPTAVFEPYLVTGADGTVTIRFELPDSLSTFRSTAVALGLDRFGIAEQELRVSAPLTALPALPRKLRWRDTGTVSLVLSNLENRAVEARVSLETETIESGHWDTVLEVDGASTRTVRIAPGASTEVSFRVAALGAGESRIIFTLNSPAVNERIIRTLSVERPVLYETVTAIGSLADENPFIVEGLVLPSTVPEGTGSLSVSLSTSQLALLGEAVRYLLDFPFESLEQRSAAILPLIAFGDQLEIFNLDLPVSNPRAIIENELANFARSQLQDGSFPFWPGGRSGNLYVSLRIAHITALARQKGYRLPAELDSQAMLRYITSVDFTRAPFRGDHFLRGYSLWIRSMYGERIGTEIAAYFRQGDELGISGWGFAGLAALELGLTELAVTARDRLRRFIRPGTRTLDLTDTYERGFNFWGADSDRYAIALMLYHALSPQDDMTGRLANSLIERQRRGFWNNSSSTYWAVLAFSRIADTERTENLNALISLGQTQLLETTFHSAGEAPVSRVWLLDEQPLASIERDSLLPFRLEREGTGRLQYTASLRYGIPTELAAARDEGIGVFAETFDSLGNRVTDGVLIPGRTYTRKVTVSSSRDRTFLALRAPVPSGAEIVDATFVTSATVQPPRNNGTGNGRRIMSDDFWNRETAPLRFIMDNELLFHWDFFPAGMREVEFRFRAVMPGVYPTPPAQAECMYEPEIFGRGAGELFRIGF